MIARNVTPQFTAGWDWQQSVRDRNTGIWDDVAVRYTGPILLHDVHAAVQRTAPGRPLSEAAAVHLQLELSSAGASCSDVQECQLSKHANASGLHRGRSAWLEVCCWAWQLD